MQDSLIKPQMIYTFKITDKWKTLTNEKDARTAYSDFFFFSAIGNFVNLVTKNGRGSADFGPNALSAIISCGTASSSADGAGSRRDES
jgi:hypothetical protein